MHASMHVFVQYTIDLIWYMYVYMYILACVCMCVSALLLYSHVFLYVWVWWGRVYSLKNFQKGRKMSLFWSRFQVLSQHKEMAIKPSSERRHLINHIVFPWKARMLETSSHTRHTERNNFTGHVEFFPLMLDSEDCCNCLNRQAKLCWECIIYR